MQKLPLSQVPMATTASGDLPRCKVTSQEARSRPGVLQAHQVIMYVSGLVWAYLKDWDLPQVNNGNKYGLVYQDMSSFGIYFVEVIHVEIDYATSCSNGKCFLKYKFKSSN